MTEGDGIRRNVAHIDSTEKQHLRDAIIALHKDRDRHYPGKREDPIPGGVSYWFKQDEIHQGTHVHGGPAFLTWHRELCNRFEDLLREVNPNLSLHYWDWTTNPYPLFTPDFMGNPNGSIGDPWKKAGFYDPDATNYRGDDPFASDHNNPFDPPKDVTRYVDPKGGGPVSKAEEALVLASRTYAEMRDELEKLHDRAHGFFNKLEGSVVTRSTISNQHTAFRDPFVFLLHSNVDRLFAMWQYRDLLKRLNPNEVYGEESSSTAFDKFGKLTSDVGILTPMEPWAGVDAHGAEAGVKPVRPWAPPENKLQLKDSKHISVVFPRPYDTALLTKAFTKELIKELEHFDLKAVMGEAKVPDRKEIPEAKVPDRKEILEGKVPDRMPPDVGVFAERLGRIEERLATMESFIRPNERPQLGQKESKQVEDNDDDDRQTEE